MDETTKVLTQHPDYWFGGEGYNGDPRSQSEDLGNDNMKANEYGIKNLKRVIAGLPTWTKQTNDRYDDLREMYGEVKIQFGRYLGHVLMNITGQYANNMPGKEPAEALPKTVQKEAIDYVGRNIFTAPTWLYPENIITKTVTDPFSEIKNDQNRALGQMFGMRTLSNIYSNSLTEKGVYQLSDYLNDVFNTVWKPIDTTSQLSASLRRSLQQEYLNDMESIIFPSKNTPSLGAIIINLTPVLQSSMNSNSVSSDVTLYVKQHLDKVESYLKSQNLSGSDINSLHYSDLLRRIKLMRDKLTNAISN